MSYLPDASPGRMLSKGAFTTLTFSPSDSPRALASSGSMPTMVRPSLATNSFGGYVGSVATTSVPFERTSAGTCAARDDCLVAAAFAGPVSLLALSPQPPAANAAVASTASVAESGRWVDRMGYLLVAWRHRTSASSHPATGPAPALWRAGERAGWCPVARSARIRQRALPDAPSAPIGPCHTRAQAASVRLGGGVLRGLGVHGHALPLRLRQGRRGGRRAGGRRADAPRGGHGAPRGAAGRPPLAPRCA